MKGGVNLKSRMLENLKYEVEFLTQDMMYAKNQVTINVLNQAIAGKLEEITTIESNVDGGV